MEQNCEMMYKYPLVYRSLYFVVAVKLGYDVGQDIEGIGYFLWHTNLAGKDCTQYPPSFSCSRPHDEMRWKFKSTGIKKVRLKKKRT